MISITKTQLEKALKSLPDFRTYEGDEYHIPIIISKVTPNMGVIPPRSENQTLIFRKDYLKFEWELIDIHIN